MARHAKCRTCFRPQPVRRDGTLFKHERGQATCEGSGEPPAPPSRLAVDFVPDNSKAYEIMAINDVRWEISRQIARQCEIARTYPEGSTERADVMAGALALAATHDQVIR